MMNWRGDAEKLFYIDSLQINDIAQKLNISRKAVSHHLKSTSGYKAEKERRKRENAKKRQQYKKQWDNQKRVRHSGTDSAALLKLQHDIDVRVLSYEKF